MENPSGRGEARAPRTGASVRAALAALLACALLWAAAPARADVTFADVSGQTARAMAATEPGDGGTRVATPYYAVFLQDALFPDGFAFEYLESLDGAFGVLNVYASSRLSDTSTGGGLACRFYCVAAGASTEPFAGSYATSAVPSSDGAYTVVVACPYGDGFATEGAGLEGSARAASYDQSAADAAGSMAAYVCADTASRSSVNAAGGIDVSTPWYTLSVPRDQFAGGWYYVYSDDVADVAGDGSAWRGRTLSVFALGQDEPAFSVCATCNCSVPGGVAQVEAGSFGGAWEGWSVQVYGASGDVAALQSYAALVSLTSDPGANPPVLG